MPAAQGPGGQGAGWIPGTPLGGLGGLGADSKVQPAGLVMPGTFTPGNTEIIGHEALPVPGGLDSPGGGVVIGRPPDGLLTAYPRGGRAYRGDPEPFAPEAFQPEKAFANPLYSVPGPLATERRGYWHSASMASTWAAPGVQGVVARTEWRTPIFDLRPELRGSGNNAPTNVVPIFRGSAYGAGVRLLWQLSRFGGGSFQNIAVDIDAFSIEGLHVSDDTQVALASAPNDITTDFWDGGLTLLLEWTPPGYPIRYWQVTLRLDQTSGVIADAPPLTAWGVCA